MDRHAKMTLAAAKKYLKDFKVRSRWTTFNGAMQLALAIPEPFNEKKIREGLQLLGQNADDLRCVYCGSEAKTWDHLFNSVQAKRFSGYGNRISNLVPACRNCNERKGAKHWRVFATEIGATPDRMSKLEAFAAKTSREAFDWGAIEKEFPSQAKEFQEVIDRIDQAITDADALAARIRTLVRKRLADD